MKAREWRTVAALAVIVAGIIGPLVALDVFGYPNEPYVGLTIALWGGLALFAARSSTRRATAALIAGAALFLAEAPHLLPLDDPLATITTSWTFALAPLVVAAALTRWTRAGLGWVSRSALAIGCACAILAGVIGTLTGPPWSLTIISGLIVWYDFQLLLFNIAPALVAIVLTVRVLRSSKDDPGERPFLACAGVLLCTGYTVAAVNPFIATRLIHAGEASYSMGSLDFFLSGLPGLCLFLVPLTLMGMLLVGRLRAAERAQLEEVRASRERLVEAGLAERRRLERDLHDGVQQHLLALGTRLARVGESTREVETRRELAAAYEDLKTAFGDLRSLARGLYPALLAQSGLQPAVESLAERSDIPIRITAPDKRWSPAIEATAYLVISEALANVSKHAAANSAGVRIVDDGERIEVSVIDDGIGGADPGGGGLTGLRDRVTALGGALDLDSPIGGGTRLSVSLPCG